MIKQSISNVSSWTQEIAFVIIVVRAKQISWWAALEIPKCVSKQSFTFLKCPSPLSPGFAPPVNDPHWNIPAHHHSLINSCAAYKVMSYRMSILTFQVCLFYDLFINSPTKYILYRVSSYFFTRKETDISKLTIFHKDTVFCNREDISPPWAATDRPSTYSWKLEGISSVMTLWVSILNPPQHLRLSWALSKCSINASKLTSVWI